MLGIYNAAVMFFAGKGVEHSFEKAAEYFQKAADRGFTAAQVSPHRLLCLNAYIQVNLGNMYYQGFGVEKNRTKAREMYALAAEEDKNAKALLEELDIEERGGEAVDNNNTK